MFASPLLVLIAAYLAVHSDAHDLPATRGDLLEDLVVHEDRYWAATADGLGTDETLRRRVVALATLAGADTEPESFEGFAPRNSQDLWMRFLGAASFRCSRFGRSPPPERSCDCGVGELVEVEEVADGDRLVAARAGPAGTEATAPGVAVVASLLAEEAGVAARACVHGVGSGHDGLGWC